MNLSSQLPDGGFKIVESLERMTAAEIDEAEVCFDRINRIYRIEIGEVEKPLDVGEFDGRAAATEVGANPLRLSFARRNKRLSAAEAETFNRPCKNFLPTMIGPADRIVTRLRHPSDVPAPQRRPPEARQPSAMNPDFVGRTKLADRSPRAE